MEVASAERGSKDGQIIAALDALAADCLYVTQDIKDALGKAEVLYRGG